MDYFERFGKVDISQFSWKILWVSEHKWGCFPFSTSLCHAALDCKEIVASEWAGGTKQGIFSLKHSQPCCYDILPSNHLQMVNPTKPSGVSRKTWAHLFLSPGDILWNWEITSKDFKERQRELAVGRRG